VDSGDALGSLLFLKLSTPVREALLMWTIGAIVVILVAAMIYLLL